jgi:hypothetical protein
MVLVLTCCGSFFAPWLLHTQGELMSGARTRARKRRARFEKIRAEFVETRSNPGAFEKLLRHIAESNQCVWTVARSVATDIPLDDAECAMIAQVVAPHLAGMTPGSVFRRQERAK